MKRFLLFYGEQSNPLGGIHDFKGDFNTQQEAIAYLSIYRIKNDNTGNGTFWLSNWGHVWDSALKKTTATFGRHPKNKK